jgi:hypothetical protein
MRSDGYWFPPVRHVGQAGNAPELQPRARGCGTLTGLEESSLRHVRFPATAGKPDGMEQETLRVPAARIGRGPQGKAAVDSIAAGAL